MVALSCSAFFNGGPPLLGPLLDSFFIALGGLLDGRHAAPACLMQQPSDMIPMIADSKGLINHLSDTACCPDTSAKTMGFSSLG
jgi:hypothetical protein